MNQLGMSISLIGLLYLTVLLLIYRGRLIAWQVKRIAKQVARKWHEKIKHSPCHCPLVPAYCQAFARVSS